MTLYVAVSVVSRGCSFWISVRRQKLGSGEGTYMDGRQAKGENAGRERYGVTAQDSDKVRVAALLYQCQEELVTPRMYSFIDEVGLQPSSQRLSVLITRQVASGRPKLSQMANEN